MKGIIISIFIGATLLGVVIWAGLTWLLGSAAESTFAQGSLTPPEDDAIDLLMVVNGEFERGFLSSRQTTHIGAPNSDADGDGFPDAAIVLQHEIYHGPIAFTPDGPIPGSGYMITKLAMDSLAPEVKEGMEEMFLGEDPMSVRTWVGIGNTLTSELTISPVQITDETTETELNFDGLVASLNFAGIEKEQITKITGEAELGGWTVTVAGTQVVAGESRGTLDFLDQDHLKAEMALGAVTFEAPDGSASGRLGEITLTVDQTKASEAFPIFLGENRLDFAEFRLDLDGQVYGIKDGLIMGKSAIDAGKVYGFVRYGVGEMTLPPEITEPILPAMALMEKGWAIEFGARGFDLASIEGMTEAAQTMQAIELQQATSGKSTEEEALMENPEYRDATVEVINRLVDLMQPGIELYLKNELKGAAGDSVGEIKVGMGGSKKLRELTTLEEILQSVSGTALVQIHNGGANAEELQAMMEPLLAEGFVSELGESFVGKAELAEGALIVNGETTPLLDDLGPLMSEPIPWDEILSPDLLLMNAGQPNPLELMEAADEADDDEGMK